jgi:hypothetical protein
VRLLLRALPCGGCGACAGAGVRVLPLLASSVLVSLLPSVWVLGMMRAPDCTELVHILVVLPSHWWGVCVCIPSCMLVYGVPSFFCAAISPGSAGVAALHVPARWSVTLRAEMCAGMLSKHVSHLPVLAEACVPCGRTCALMPWPARS